MGSRSHLSFRPLHRSALRLPWLTPLCNANSRFPARSARRHAKLRLTSGRSLRIDALSAYAFPVDSATGDRHPSIASHGSFLVILKIPLHGQSSEPNTTCPLHVEIDGMAKYRSGTRRQGSAAFLLSEQFARLENDPAHSIMRWRPLARFRTSCGQYRGARLPTARSPADGPPESAPMANRLLQ